MEPYGVTAVAITPGWLRSEMMLDNFGVSEENWRDAIRTTADNDQPAAPADFALSESPRYVGRAVVALAADPDRARWNKKSVSSGQLALEYGFNDLDGSQPDWARYIEEIREPGLDATPTIIGNSHADRDQALLVNAQAFAKRSFATQGLVKIRVHGKGQADLSELFERSTIS